ncbi:MAG: ATP-dependent DNA helicase RecG [Candidatus Omnitrophica bacterium]|nr:ATP-dependent DNA helicase RecG [Candidatus Omnitrophota bacterium]
MIPIRYVKGVGPKREKILNRVGVFFLKDLLYYFPVRYQDRSHIEQINLLEEGKTSLIRAEITSLKVSQAFYGRKATIRASLRDSTGNIQGIWFNQPYLKDYLKIGLSYYFYGKIQRYNDRLQIVSAEFERLNSEDDLDISGIVAFYRLTQGLSQNNLRRLIRTCFSNYRNQIVETIPFDIRKEYNFPNILEALSGIHSPASFEDIKRSRQRFIFEEFFIMQILLFRRKAELRLKRRPALSIDHSVVDKVKNNFGFTLTGDQEKAICEVFSDVSSDLRNSRLLQGDVGSGKTVVASIAAFCVARSGFQVAFMVPTEVLAIQHKKTLEGLAKGLDLKIDIITSGLAIKKRKDIYAKLSQGKIDIIVGTHALLNEDLRFKNLRFVVVDEQHRFGVAQRALLARKGIDADILVMSATPIPRSLALTLYGDLEVSLIKEYPKGRKFARTEIVKEKERGKVYEFIRQKVQEGRQVYIIYALVEESSQEDLYPAVQMYERLVKEFKSLRLGLLHGRLDSRQKQSVLNNFKNNEIDILVSTLVVEVGLDIPNATVMVVENPERFGLAQLHQLRGRITRSNLPSYFFMIAKKDIYSSARKRLEVIAETCDGFKIAEQDLELRGPGDLFGTLQAGYLPTSIASSQDDLKILETARSRAFKVIKKDPYLELRQHKELNSAIKEYIDKGLLWQAS